MRSWVNRFKLVSGAKLLSADGDRSLALAARPADASRARADTSRGAGPRGHPASEWLFAPP